MGCVAATVIDNNIGRTRMSHEDTSPMLRAGEIRVRIAAYSATESYPRSLQKESKRLL